MPCETFPVSPIAYEAKGAGSRVSVHAPTLPTREAWITRWMRAHPRIVDVVVVAVCTCLQHAALAGADEQVKCSAYVALGIASAALLWRRRFPFTVLVIVTVVAAVRLLISPELTYQALPSAFALYAVAARRSTGRAALGYLLSVALPALATPILALRQSAPFSPNILDPLALMALALGIALRARRQRNDSLITLMQQRAERAALAERARITAEMHDIVAHSLTVMIALAGGARTGWDKHPERAREALDRLGDVGATALGEMQRILRVLRTNDNELHEGLHDSGHNVPSLEELVGVFRAAGLPVTLSRQGATAGRDPVLETTIHRIVQESLTNALRYAENATVVRVELTTTPSAIEVAVVDDGAPGSRRPTVGAGVGLLGIRERAAAFGGTSTAGPLAGGGWRTYARLPSRRMT